jgi:hypothetical protein
MVSKISKKSDYELVFITTRNVATNSTSRIKVVSSSMLLVYPRDISGVLQRH